MALLLVYFYFVLDETDTSRFVQVRSVKRKHFIFFIGVLVLKKMKIGQWENQVYMNNTIR